MRILFLFIFISNVVAFVNNPFDIRRIYTTPLSTYGDPKQDKWNQKTKWIDTVTYCSWSSSHAHKNNRFNTVSRFLSSSSQTEEENEKLKNTQNVRMVETSVQIMQGPFSSQDFAKSRCWGKKPLLIRSAFDPLQVKQEFGKWPDKDDLVMMSCDEDAESR